MVRGNQGENAMTRLGLAIAALFMVLAPGAITAQKDDSEGPQTNDIVAAASSVVRVALIGSDPKAGEFLLGHGSGVAIGPGLIVTNAHVVAPLREAPNIAITIVPSAGNLRYSGQLVAVDERADLALIRTREGVVEPLAIYSGRPEDTGRVAAIGYPGSVDLAENLSANDQVSPMQAVRTLGQLSGGRSRRDVDTLLHTAPMARGNSGGPLVDECGRVIGINSFGTLAEANDAEFGFAISARELIPFLERANVRPNVTAEACVPASERARQTQADAERERDRRIRRIIEQREFGLGVAVGLLVLGALVLAGGGVSLLYRNSWKRARIVGALGIVSGVLLIALAVFIFLNRPSLANVDDEARAEVGWYRYPALSA